jgi:serine/threonine protein kinase
MNPLEDASAPRLRPMPDDLEGSYFPTESIRPRKEGKVPTESSVSLPRIPGYEIVRELGRGGMGIVYEARHQRLNRVVAMKTILHAKQASRADRDRFENEARAIAALSHPNIVGIHEIGEYAGVTFLSLEFVPGGTLADQLHSPLSPRRSAEVVVALAEGVQAAHESGIVHRDLKPANVLMTRDGTPKISDFGLAKRLDSSVGLTETGQILGTPCYMSPEQTLGEKDGIHESADIYALGAILYHLLTGRPPFLGPTAQATLYQVFNAEPVGPRELQAEVPRDLETICLKCLEKRPADRYASARELANDLKAHLRGEPIAARSPGVFDRAYRWSRRKPLLALSIAIQVLMYGLHLFAKDVLNDPKHQGFFHRFLTVHFVTFFCTSILLQRLIDRERWRQVGRYGFTIQIGVAVILGLSVDKGAASAPIWLLMLLPGAGCLIVPHPRIVWIMTGLAAVGYLSLVGVTRWFYPEHALNGETIVSFLFGLILTGVIHHLCLRRLGHVEPAVGIQPSTRGGPNSSAPTAPRSE